MFLTVFNFQIHIWPTLESAASAIISGVNLQNGGIVAGGAPSAGPVDGVMVATGLRVDMEVIGAVILVVIGHCIRSLKYKTRNPPREQP